ncbi:MAG: HAMP domain-containing protein [Clostridia bacterium]|nr:HAMP domain-containing protein [Clostridia bacterium]
MYNSLYFKIILILVIFMITVMCVIGTVLINNVNSFYMDEFTEQMEQNLSAGSPLTEELRGALAVDDFASEQLKILNSYRGVLGIDDYRNFYILDGDGAFLEGSDSELGSTLQKTTNLIAAMRGKPDNTQPLGADFADYALKLTDADTECIIYVRDSMEEMQQFTWILFSIILQALMFGLIFAIILAFFLSKAITSPIQSLTRGAKLIAAGEFSHELDIHANDEIGKLTDTFNYMKKTLKNTLEEVSGEHQKLETVFTYLHDGVIAFTEDGKVMHINESVKELLGSKYDEKFNFSRFIELLDIDYNPNFSVEYVDRKDGVEGDGYNVSDVMFDGKVLDVNFGDINYMADNTSHRGVLAVIHDETGRYELDKSRREFVANVSHEMRTPLTSIKGACETILSDPDMEPDMEDFFLHMAVDECDRMTRIVSDLLVLSRLDNKRTQWSIEAFDPHKILTHICEVMRVDADAHSHELIYAPSGTLPEITADKERIEQVIINIISNAIKYTPDGGTINIGARAADEGLEICVRDTGIGIPEEDLPHLFERFYRVEKSRTSETGGTGLGLAIAKEIVEAHGGTISIESIRGKGSTVTLLLPFETKLKSVE